MKGDCKTCAYMKTLKREDAAKLGVTSPYAGNVAVGAGDTVDVCMRLRSALVKDTFECDHYKRLEEGK